MLDKPAVPEETEEERADEHHEDKHNERFEYLLKVATFNDVGKHLLCTQKKNTAIY